MYKHTFKRCAWLFAAGTALHLLLGPLHPSFLAYPWGAILAVNYLYLLVLLYTMAGKWTWVKTLYNRQACIAAFSTMLVLTLLFGLIRQDPATGGLTGLLGFSQMTSSWIFNIFLVYFMTVIGLTTIDDLYHWKKRNKFALLFHLAFWVILVSAVFGSGDKIRVRVTTTVGQPVQGGTTADGRPHTLPFSILLKEFSMDEYPPRLYLYSQGKLSKHFVTLEESASQGLLGNWQVKSVQTLDKAGRRSDADDYAPMNHVGATTAAWVEAVHTTSRQTAKGWVSCGSHIFDGATLALPDGSEIVMPRREPKRYLSKVELADKTHKWPEEIRVNHPATVGSWKIYQVGYDTDRGRWSTVSMLECVKDSWYPAIHIAMWLVVCLGVVMCLFGWKKPANKKEEKS